MVDKIRKLCKEANMSISELERSTGISRGYIHKWDEHSPTIINVKRVADYFGITVDELVN